MTEPRLDAATMKWCANLIRTTNANNGLKAMRDAHPESFWGGFVASLDELATRAASLPPTLADWVRAALESKLGPPARTAGSEEWAEDPRDALRLRWRSVDLAVDILTAEPFVAYIGRWPHGALGWQWCEHSIPTPAALTAALDALASEASRG